MDNISPRKKQTRKRGKRMRKQRTKSKRYQGIFMSIILLLGTFLPLMGAQRVEAATVTGIAEHIVISQVYGGGGNAGATYTHDFIELYNPTDKDVRARRMVCSIRKRGWIWLVFSTIRGNNTCRNY